MPRSGIQECFYRNLVTKKLNWARKGAKLLNYGWSVHQLNEVMASVLEFLLRIFSESRISNKSGWWSSDSAICLKVVTTLACGEIELAIRIRLNKMKTFVKYLLPIHQILQWRNYNLSMAEVLLRKLHEASTEEFIVHHEWNICIYDVIYCSCSGDVTLLCFTLYVKLFTLWLPCSACKS